MTKAKTVKVRIAVAVDAKGKWNAEGWSGINASNATDFAIENLDTNDETHVVFVEAPVPLPPPPKVVKGKVVAKGAKR